MSKTLPTFGLICVVLGGICTGWLKAVETGAAGALVAQTIAIVRKSMTPRAFWEALLETGHITAAILFLITGSSIYSRMLGLAGLPSQPKDLFAGNSASFRTIMLLYVLLFLGTLLDTASIILIVVPRCSCLWWRRWICR